METKTTQKGRTIHKKNCTPTVRKKHESYKSIITLTGTYGFEWSVAIQAKDNPCFISITSFENREKAVKHYKMLIKNI